MCVSELIAVGAVPIGKGSNVPSPCVVSQEGTSPTGLISALILLEWAKLPIG